jgi:hypothetical protein
MGQVLSYINFVVVIIIIYCNWAFTRWQQFYTSPDKNKGKQNNKTTTKHENNYNTIKISTQTEHRKCKYIHITETHTHITKHMKLKHP